MTTTDVQKIFIGGYKLITANIVYHLPDYNYILQEFIWQNYDNPPEYRHLKKFIKFWENNIDARIKEIEIAETDFNKRTKLINPKIILDF